MKPCATEQRQHRESGSRIAHELDLHRAGLVLFVEGHRRVQALLLRINSENATAGVDLTMGALIGRYEQEEMPQRYSTRAAYRSYLDQHIKPRWEGTSIHGLKAMAVEGWLNGLELAPKTKAHIKQIMHVVFRCALRWELVEKNPISLVRVKGIDQATSTAAGFGDRRIQAPRILSWRATPNHGLGSRVFGFAGQRDCRAPVGRLRREEPDGARSAGHRAWASRSCEDRVLKRCDAG